MSRPPSALRRRIPTHRRRGWLGLTLAATLAIGCVSVPPPLQGEWSAITPRALSETDVGTPVRWGGRIVAVDAEGGRTCFRMIAQPLAPNGQPDGSDASLGPFSACRAGRYDPRTFAPNRELTITGRVEGFDEAAASSQARAPRVAAQAIVLWPRRR